MHTEGGIHADLKPLNAVGDGNTWKLIDFDVFCKVGKPFGNKVPSSGYCPPEMARVLLEATDQDTGKVDTTKLKLYTANVAYDLWSFGVVLFHLVFGMPLWRTDQNDNVAPSDLRALAGWTTATLNTKLFEAKQNQSSVPRPALDHRAARPSEPPRRHSQRPSAAGPVLRLHQIRRHYYRMLCSIM